MKNIYKKIYKNTKNNHQLTWARPGGGISPRVSRTGVLSDRGKKVALKGATSKVALVLASIVIEADVLLMLFIGGSNARRPSISGLIAVLTNPSCIVLVNRVHVSL